MDDETAPRTPVLAAAQPTRRVVIKSAAAAAAYLWAGATAARADTSLVKIIVPPSRTPLAHLRFFSAEEFAILDEFAEMLIPADSVSGGARSARVAWTLDERLAESLDPDWRKSWHDDLAEIDRLSRLRFDKTFLAASRAQRNDLMRSISSNEADPKEPGEYAFGTIKWSVADIYYRTRIGIHDDLGYLGNVMQDEFSGTDVSKRP